MKAMILAAGLGTRLRPLTDTRPKALIDVHGRPLLEHVLLQLIEAGVREVIINVHHFPEQIEGFLESRQNFGIRIELSHEPQLLGTGGGLKKAAPFFDDGQPFFLHNVDILSNIDLKAMYRFHRQHDALATLAVMQRSGTRFLLFDEAGRLCGWQSGEKERLARKTAHSPHALAFCGVHVISPALFERMTETGAFSIIDTYVRLAAEHAPILAFRADGATWHDVGRLKDLEALRKSHK